MAYVRSRKFCCCLPVRFGVFVMSLAALLFGGLIAIGAWLELKNDKSLAKNDHNAVIVYGVMFSLLALVGGFGFLGTLSKQTGLVSIFGTMLGFHLGFSIATGIFTIVTLFKRNTDEALANCINGSTDQTTIDSCHEGLKILKVVVVVAYCVSWLVELYGCLIVSSYVKQLREEEDANTMSAPHVIPNAPMSHYDPNAPMSHYVPPPQPTYAFTQPNQAIGSHA
ncbi:hypothetical protein DFH06DRAFT_1266144 [Mycena polygramma]|nr:hypothetical protein C8R47DRAFT_1210342 [Mycena vitilis]KAJ7678276.1 hypothetical protein DFH06DRAFT_1266144 [Mycena polygramma]